ncbi:MAG: D-alanyl-D-alanine carboxypeptidase/D-alanyl-D-alanine-endopeptidase [Bacteroidales bacterium]|jgi:D-alanyl-D-alanine carboxypeptidase/D-alanyl-D-alanine-endopeptidase (penicillin-binding protein 4)|nr:D-alanyl-D-alanine carboxypeptidase/D-alanyl-D-alanine-endopeptidase [Bacteroidales bacterium]
MKKLPLIFVIIFNITICNSQTYNDIFKVFLSKSELKNANIGLYVENLNTKEIIYKYNENISMIPASIFKIFPTSIALELFGPEYKFKTEISYSGKIDTTGILNGDLYIIGGGDPCLGSTNYSYHYEQNNKNIIQQWTDAIAKAGIKKINGNVIADVSYFGKINIPNRWTWDDIGNFYGHQGSALNYLDNMYYVHFSTGATDGASTKITYVVPSDLNLKFNNTVTASTKSGDNAYIFFGDNNYQKDIKGTLPAGKSDFVIKGSMPEVEIYLAQSLINILIKNKISVTGISKVIFETDKKSKTLIHTTYSPELQIIIENINKKSNNTYAQILSYHIAKKSGKDYPIYVYDYLSLKKISTDGLNVDDACGLSHFNTLTAYLMVNYLKFLKTDYSQSQIFIKSLPIAGISGTLNSLAVGDKIKVVAKSGSMFKIASYAGFMTDKSGNEFVFCFVINNFKGNYYNIQRYYEELFKNFGEVK